MTSATCELPYKVATLLYCFDLEDRILLIQRAREPNQGLWSPCGGKLEQATGESPFSCARREAREEIGLSLSNADIHLTGIVSEAGYQGQTHWLMFLFEVTKRLTVLPVPHDEGNFGFFPRSELMNLPLPQTDKKWIWPMFWRHRRGFFSAHCHCDPLVGDRWVLEQSVLPRRGDLDKRRLGVCSVTNQSELKDDRSFMKEALAQAHQALKEDEVPVGAVVVLNGQVLTRAFNQVEKQQDATAHAEMLAIKQAAALLGDRRLNGCTLYVTKEPCFMCAGALIQARVGRVVFGAYDPNAGAAGSAINLLDFNGANHSCRSSGGICEEECGEILSEFFANKRNRGEP